MRRSTIQSSVVAAISIIPLLWVSTLVADSSQADTYGPQIWFVRHAESEINVTDRWHVPDADVTYPLTSKGMKQARSLAERTKDVPIIEIYASTRLRAIQTADAIAFTHQIPIRLAPEMVEIDIGAYGSEKSNPEIVRFLQDRWATDPSASYGEGESIVDLQNRVFPFIEQLMERHQNDEGVVIVAAHGGSISLGAVPLCHNEIFPDDLDPSDLPNTGILKTTIRSGKLICTNWVGQRLNVE